jgi:hypothetical protein
VQSTLASYVTDSTGGTKVFAPHPDDHVGVFPTVDSKVHSHPSWSQTRPTNWLSSQTERLTSYLKLPTTFVDRLNRHSDPPPPDLAWLLAQLFQNPSPLVRSRHSLRARRHHSDLPSLHYLSWLFECFFRVWNSQQRSRRVVWEAVRRHGIDEIDGGGGGAGYDGR